MGNVDNQKRKFIGNLLVARADLHATLTQADRSALERLPFQTRSIDPEQDIVRQGDRPDWAVFVVRGMLGRYQTLPTGDRQYLSFHISSDMPDVQSLFLTVMDHSVCAMDQSEIALFRHDKLADLFLRRPGLAFAFWRITLVDAAIFRQAITNNSSRKPASRLAHFCCEQYFRAREAGLADGSTCSLPLNQTQMGQTLGMSHISVHRALQTLRRNGLLDLRGGKLEILHWKDLVDVAGFDPGYLHIAKESEISRTPFRGR
jgi:CRP-like cAMP-binding protein